MRYLLSLFLILSSCASSPVHFDKPFGFTPLYEEGSKRSYFEKPNEFVAVFPPHTYGPSESGYNFSARILPSVKKVISYDVKFDEKFNFVKGGKLPGLCGRTKATGGNRADGYNGFSARIMWREDGQIVSYVYHVNQKTQYGDDFEWASHQVALQFQKGVWHKIKVVVVLNDLEKSNGIIRGYLDGELAFEKTDFVFRNTYDIQIDRLCFNTFFGGNDESWASDKEEKLSIRGLKVYEEY